MGYDDGVSTLPMVSPKFIKSTLKNQSSNQLCHPKSKSIIMFQPISSCKMNISPKASSSKCSSSGILCLPTISPIFHHCGEHGHLRFHYRKFTFHPLMKIDVSAYSFSLSRTTLLSQRSRLFNSSLCLCYCCDIVGHLVSQSGCSYYGSFEHL